MASSAFARHYLRNHFCFLFLLLLRCFSSEGSRLFNMSSTCWVAPFGHLRIKGRLHLPAAFRSLPRPSSSPEAKASSIRSYFTSYSLTLRLFALSRRSTSGALFLGSFNYFTFFTTPLFPSLVNELFVTLHPLSQICPAKAHPILMEHHNGNTKWTRTIL